MFIIVVNFFLHFFHKVVTRLT